MTARILTGPANASGSVTSVGIAGTRPGSLLVLLALGPTATTGATDTAKNIWSLAVQSSVSFNVAVYWTINRVSTPGTNTITVSGAAQANLIAFEVAAGAVSSSVMGAVPVLDQTSKSGTTAGTADPGNITPLYTSSFLVTGVVCNSAQSIGSNPSGWTISTGGDPQHAACHLLPSAITSQDGKFVLTGSTSFDVAQAAFGFVNPDAARLVVPRPKPFLV